MKPIPSSLRWLVLVGAVIAAGFAVGVTVLLTTLPRTFPGIRTIARLLDGSDVNDAIGHALLFGLLTLAVYGALRLRLRFAFAFWLSLGLVLALSTATEWAQRFSAGRTVSLSDLLANWVGVLAVGTVISFCSRTRPNA